MRQAIILLRTADDVKEGSALYRCFSVFPLQGKLLRQCRRHCGAHNRADVFLQITGRHGAPPTKLFHLETQQSRLAQYSSKTRYDSTAKCSCGECNGWLYSIGTRLNCPCRLVNQAKSEMICTTVILTPLHFMRYIITDRIESSRYLHSIDAPSHCNAPWT